MKLSERALALVAEGAQPRYILEHFQRMGRDDYLCAAPRPRPRATARQRHG